MSGFFISEVWLGPSGFTKGINSPDKHKVSDELRSQRWAADIGVDGGNLRSGDQATKGNVDVCVNIRHSKREQGAFIFNSALENRHTCGAPTANSIDWVTKHGKAGEILCRRFH
jgi:hypothetical protein